MPTSLGISGRLGHIYSGASGNIIVLVLVVLSLGFVIGNQTKGDKPHGMIEFSTHDTPASQTHLAYQTTSTEEPVTPNVAESPPREVTTQIMVEPSIFVSQQAHTREESAANRTTNPVHFEVSEHDREPGSPISPSISFLLAGANNIPSLLQEWLSGLMGSTPSSPWPSYTSLKDIGNDSTPEPALPPPSPPVVHATPDTSTPKPARLKTELAVAANLDTPKPSQNAFSLQKSTSNLSSELQSALDRQRQRNAQSSRPTITHFLDNKRQTPTTRQAEDGPSGLDLAFSKFSLRNRA